MASKYPFRLIVATISDEPAYRCAGGAIAALPFYLWELLHDERTALNARGLVALAYVAGPGGALMYYLFNRSVEALGASKAGVLLYHQWPFVTTFGKIQA